MIKSIMEIMMKIKRIKNDNLGEGNVHDRTMKMIMKTCDDGGAVDIDDANDELMTMKIIGF